MIGFIGLGQMGKPMALNIARGAEPLTVCDINPSNFEAFNGGAAKTTTDIAELANADIVFLSLPTGDVVKTLLLGDSGLLWKSKAGQIIVDTSTIGYNTTIEIAQSVTARGLHFIDAPVSGMEARAVDGTLTVMCGGDRAHLQQVRPYLERVGNNILHMGGVGSGQLTKLINQLLFNINAAALAEILPMSVKLGLDPTQVGAVINSGTGRSYASEFFIPRILETNFSDGYAMKHAYKDLVSAAELSAKLGIPLPVLAAATATYQTALRQGYGDLDKGAMIRVFEQLLDVQFRAKRPEMR